MNSRLDEDPIWVIFPRTVHILVVLVVPTLAAFINFTDRTRHALSDYLFMSGVMTILLWLGHFFRNL
jgi:hypothetical protein